MRNQAIFEKCPRRRPQVSAPPSAHMSRILAAVEGGGTTFVVAIGYSPTDIFDRQEFPTTTPQETLAQCVEWLGERSYDALGVACFGPIDLQPSSPTYGYITTTPKPGWQNVDVLGPLRAVRDVPFGFDTDVNAPAVAEHAFAVAEAVKAGKTPPSSCCYITVGTGIGVGLVINNAPVHGLMHPEGGHVCVPRRAADAGFEGPNPTDCFGGACAENMCCSVSLAKRGSLPSTAALADLYDDDPLWEAASHYLGALCANVVLLASPERIVLSGGVMQRSSLFPRVRLKMQACLNGYIKVDACLSGVDSYVIPSTWGNDAGLVGALTLASKALTTPEGGEQGSGLPDALGGVPLTKNLGSGGGGSRTRALATLAVFGALSAAMAMNHRR